jgi:hypothetical protein
MKRNQDIANELRLLAPDISWPAETPFRVPAGYFIQFPETLLQQLHTMEQEPVPFAITPFPFTVPAGYFETLPQAILDHIHSQHPSVQEELDSIAPSIAAIPRHIPFSVPAGYFTTLSAISPVPVTHLQVVHKNRVNTWLKWTVAACLTAFIGTTALMFLQTDNIYSIEKQLEGVNDQDIVNYLETHTDTFYSDAIFTSVAESSEAAAVQQQLNELPSTAVEKYLQQPDLSKELLHNE